VKEKDSQIFTALGDFLLTMIYETEYFIEVPAAKQSELPLNVMDASHESRVYCLQEQREILVR
jgi:hypothetical protein